jgi:ubiquinone/menaquinone biosynthesis C-methylase UbiE
MTAAGWLDTHFEANRPEYEAMVRSVPIEPGWRVLDAGCGSGSFLPFLADMVGPDGRLTAFDLAPDNVAAVEERLKDWRLTCPVQTRVGTLVELPFPDNSFDAVWCANTLQYLNDAELTTALGELQRVVRAGGVVAIKDHTADMRIDPASQYFLERAFIAGWQAEPRPGFRVHGGYRGPSFRTILLESDLVDVWAKSTLIERWAPLRPVEQALWRDALRAFSGSALQHDLPAEDLALWRELSDPAGAAAFVARPDFYVREVNVVAVGRVV